MLPVLALLALTLVAPPARTCTAPVAVVADSAPTPAALWQEGMTFGEFSGRFKSRREAWAKRNGWGAFPDLTAARMRAISAPLRILVVAEEECGDSMNSIPYLVRLVALAPSIEVRLVDSRKGHAVMESHRTPDGRAATPTIVVLDQADRVVACWVERPAALVRWSKTPTDSLPADQRFGGRLAWYENDKGASAMAEWVPLLEGAGAGRMTCGS